MKTYAWSNRHSEARARGWVGAGTASSGVASPSQLLPDNDANFTTTIGSWTHSAGTLVRDTGTHLPTLVASALFTPTGTGDHIDLPISGTFQAGLPYVLVLVLRQGTVGTTTKAEFGVLGTDQVTWGDFALPTTGGWAISLPWTPAADVTGVSARVTVMTTSGTERVLAARLFQTAQSSVTEIGGNDFLPTPVAPTDRVRFGPGQVGQLTIWPRAMELAADSYLGVGIDFVDAGSGGNSTLYEWVEHNAADFADEGFNLEVGEDYVGLYVSEKDAGTVQVYADTSGGYDIELKDRGTTHWKLVTAAGTAAAIPSMGMLPQYSAAPHAGTETEGESYYDTTLHKPRTWNGSSWNNWF